MRPTALNALCAVAIGAALSPSLPAAAQQAEPQAAAQNADAAPAATADAASAITCDERPPLEEVYGGEPSAEEMARYASEGAATIGACIDRIRDGVEKLRQSDASFQENWDVFNQQLQSLFDQVNNEIQRVRGKGGLIESGELLTAIIETERSDVERLFADDEEGKRRRLADLDEQKKRLGEFMQKADSYSLEINEMIISLHAKRPKIASDMRRREIKSLVDDFGKASDELRSTAQILGEYATTLSTDSGTGQ